MKKVGLGLLFIFVIFVIGSSLGMLYGNFLNKFLPKKVQYEPVSYTESYIEFLRPEVDPELRSIIAKHVDKNCAEMNLAPELVISVIAKESSFVPWAVSRQNCIGLMQINPPHHKEKCEGYTRSQLFHIEHNVRIGCMILKEYLEMSKTPEEALGRYIGEQGALTYKKDILNMTVQLYQRRI